MSKSLHTSPEVQDLINCALTEDKVYEDVTTMHLFPPDHSGSGVIKSGTPGVLAGMEVAFEVFHKIDPSIATQQLIRDGSKIEAGQELAHVEGNIIGILKAERTALNFLQRMSGIATATSQYIENVVGLKAKILDTRKTIPGWRKLDKYAVRTGGGQNHRMDLADGVLIKDNHVTIMKSLGLTVADIVRLALKQAAPTIKVEIEVETFEEAQEALEAAAPIILLDNMSLEEMQRVVQMVNGRALLEASGGVDLQSVRAIAETGVDFISVGSLTHSASAMDISLDLD